VGGTLLAACALALVIEGLLPFISPSTWRQVFMHAAQMRDDQIRLWGLGSMLAGLGLLLFVTS
jgi:uncharacterized protein